MSTGSGDGGRVPAAGWTQNVVTWRNKIGHNWKGSVTLPSAGPAEALSHRGCCCPIQRRRTVSEVNVGLLVRIEALAGKEDEVAAFLAGALPLALDEPATTAWFAIRIGPSTFGVFDVFAGEEGREAHLAGQIAAALIGSVGTLVEAPTIEKVDVLAAKL